MTPDLQRLARLHGIADHYLDNRGRRHELGEAVLRHLLHRLGAIPERDATDEAIGEAVHAERVALWQPGLPPVRVIRAGGEIGAEIVVPEEALHSRWRWTLRAEDGATLTGEFRSAELAESGDPHDRLGWANAHYTRIDERTLRRFHLPLPEVPEGYHDVMLEMPDDADEPGAVTDEGRSEGALGGRHMRLIVVPARCHEGEDSEARHWGVGLQLYALRSRDAADHGDFGHLARAIDALGAVGGDLVGVNPLHALFPRDPERASPYSPSSRLFINPLYIDLDATAADIAGAPGDAPTDDAHGAPATVDADPPADETFIDYAAVATRRQAALEARFRDFLERDLATGSAAAEDFARFRARGGRALEGFARHEALHECHGGTPEAPAGDWQNWPEAYHDCRSAAVETFAEAEAERITRHAWLQWLAHRQLEAAAARARAAGLTVGLYKDLAVGVAPGGADTWAHPSLFVREVHVGAPPDDFSLNGQDWGLPPLNPRTLRRRGFEPFVEILRAAMHAAGAVRIDHVMGLMRLFWIPAGESPAEGIYVDYPFEEMLGIVALESRRRRCLVIGEDLGTVPAGLRERLAEAGVLSYRLLYFEKHYDTDGRFRAAGEYPRDALAAADSHDLPTLRGFWSGADLALRESLSLFPDEDTRRAQFRERAEDRERLLELLVREGLLDPQARDTLAGQSAMPPEVLAAVHRCLARSPARLLLASLEDLVGQSEQINLPGTDRDVHPNWRRRIAVPVEDWLRHPSFVTVARAIAAERGSDASGH